METITCIYCRNLRPRPARGEHVMLEALGGTITIPEVCGGRGGCNQKFGDTIDRELLRNSPVTLHRLILSKGQDHEQQMFYFRADHGVWLDALVRVGERAMVIPPQVYIHDGKPFVIATREFEAQRIALLGTSVDDLCAATRIINDWDQHAPARLVFQPARGRYVVRARSEEDCDSFFDVLKAKLPDLAARATGGVAVEVNLGLEKPLILPLGTSINDSPRCASKMAFNFLAHHLGANVALRPEFNSVRDYISGKKVNPIEEVVAPDGELGVTVDTRHVANWFTTDLTANHWKLLRESHYIVLHAQSYEIGAEVGLFGGRSRFLVRFAKVGKDLIVKRPLPAVLVTPIGGGGDCVLAGHELAETLMRSGRA